MKTPKAKPTPSKPTPELLKPQPKPHVWWVPQPKLRIWWIPQVPAQGEPFRTDVATPREGKLLLTALAKYDQYQFEHQIKPDYCNAGGLEVLEDGEWTDWCNEEGQGIDDLELEDLAAPR